MSDDDLFLTQVQVANFTGVRIGRGGKTREQLQADALTKMRVPHYVNAAGRCQVARAVVEGGRAKAEQQAPAWAPGVVARA